MQTALDSGKSSILNGAINGDSRYEVRLSEGLDLLHTQGQRGPSNDRWIDDGQSQAGAPATEIAQVIEEQFLLPLCSVPKTNASTERRFQNSGVLENKPFDNPLSNDGQVVVDGDYTSCNQTEVQQGNDNEVTRYQPNPTAKNIPGNKQVDSWSSFSDADGDGITIPQPLISSPDSPTGNAGKSTSARTTSGFGLRLSPKSPAADDILEGTSSTSQSRIFGKLTKRYQEGGFDLDITYTSENIIDMGFPADDMSSGFSGYVEGLYDVSLFEGKVASLPFDDHNCPLTQLIISFCQSAYLWLKEDIKNVEVVHCKAGMARPGLMISSLLMYLKFFPTAEESIDYYNQKKKLPYKFHKPLKIQARIGKVMTMLRNFQQHLQDLDVSIKLGIRVKDLIIEDGHVVGVKVSDSRNTLKLDCYIMLSSWSRAILLVIYITCFFPMILNVNRYRYEDTYGGITSQFCDLECGEDSNRRTEDQMHKVETSIEIARNMQFVNGM
ncbi:hypothetical protein POTOM_014002 [Populus tomentosa]|uniref:Uncharacterized protein n=1 Tax=Populus tomentosa TaxID=118781 RepID=A0A8X8D825_POPTO|nr:hypothetical protein POTOM_014002 [Populus tomentosa]